MKSILLPFPSPNPFHYLHPSTSTPIFKQKDITFSDKFEELFLSFSLFTTVPLVTTTKQGKNAIECLNGIRVLAFIAVVIGHTYALGTFDTYPRVLGTLKYQIYGAL